MVPTAAAKAGAPTQSAGRAVHNARTGPAQLVTIPRSTTLPALTAAQAAGLQAATSRMNRHRGGAPLRAPRAAGAARPAPTTFTPPKAAFVTYPGPNDLYSFRHSSLTNVTPNPTPYGSPNPSEVDEPSVSNNGSEVFYTGNWYAASSADSGESWSYSSPYTALTPPMGQQFCCDQSTVYDPTRDITIWNLLYSYPYSTSSPTDGDNVLRLAVANGQAGVNTGSWHTFDVKASLQFVNGTTPIFTPGSWIDYPQVGLNESSFFISANIFRGPDADPGCVNSSPGSCIQQGSVMMRISLDALAATAPLAFDFYTAPCTNSDCPDTFTPVLRTGSTMYWAAHGGTGQVADPTDVRVYAWPDGQPAGSVVVHHVQDLGFSYMYGPGIAGGTGTCLVTGSPVNPCARDDSRIRAGWLLGNQLSFTWDALQDGAYPFPYVRGIQINTSTWTAAGDPVIAYSNTAAIYPFIATNGRGALGISMVIAGGPYYPSSQAGVQDDLTPPGTWSFWWLAQGTGNPIANEWGDYLAVRPASIKGKAAGNTWLMSGFSIQNGRLVPTFNWFGRARDDPFVASNVTCGAAMTGLAMGAQSPSQLMASFTATSGMLSEYRWSIDWGDGTSSSGQVNGTGTNGTVMAGHAFASAGAPLTVTVSIGDQTQTPASCTLPATVTGSVYTTTSRQQYSLWSDGVSSWQPIDADRLVLRLTAPGLSTAILSANADLWTSNNNVNQDIGISVDGTVLAWKESGGSAGTYSPNAAFVHAAVPMTAGAHTVSLVWKSNGTVGKIYAGAGPIGFDYSPTRLTAQLLPRSASTFDSKELTTQPLLTNSTGKDWIDLTTLDKPFPVPGAGSLLIGGNADLWTANAGINQDLGIKVDGNLVAWKESGGYAGTASPNAAFVQAVVPVQTAGPHTVKLVWKANKSAIGTIAAGAGPIAGNFSPTTLTVHYLPAAGVADASSTTQYSSFNDNAMAWLPIDQQRLSLSIPTSAANCVAIVGGNADLWTATAGYNQDMLVSVDGSVDAWKESGGFGGTFSPNAAYVETVVPVPAGTAPSVQLKWKNNLGGNAAATIYAGAGPLGGAFSPTRLTAQLVCS